MICEHVFNVPNVMAVITSYRLIHCVISHFRCFHCSNSPFLLAISSLVLELKLESEGPVSSFAAPSKPSKQESSSRHQTRRVRARLFRITRRPL